MKCKFYISNFRHPGDGDRNCKPWENVPNSKFNWTVIGSLSVGHLLLFSKEFFYDQMVKDIHDPQETLLKRILIDEKTNSILFKMFQVFFDQIESNQLDILLTYFRQKVDHVEYFRSSNEKPFDVGRLLELIMQKLP